MITKVCPQCKKSFTTQYKTQIFCSKLCYGASISHKVELICPICGKLVLAYKDAKFCSKKCADQARRGVKLVPVVMKTCPVCSKSFELKWKTQQFCSKECAAKGMYRPPKHNITEEGMIAKRNQLKSQWQNAEFRQAVIDRMKTNNPVHMPGVVEKANITRAKNGKMHNNFKYGNGKIGPYEQVVKDKIENLGFIYNYAIVTKSARETYPNANYAHCYKPDFVNLESKLCIEIDGYGHSTKEEKKADAKKEKCLNFLGYTVIRFTHKEIDEGVFDKWLNSYQENM